jgi:hypothetical protein
VCNSTTGAPRATAASSWRAVGLDEQRDADAGIAQPGDHRLQVVVLAGGVEPALGGPLLALLGTMQAA